MTSIALHGLHGLPWQHLRHVLGEHSANYGKTPRFDSGKAVRELGIKWTPLKKCLQDMAARELELVRGLKTGLHSHRVKS